jgi:hypothetical protein
MLTMARLLDALRLHRLFHRGLMLLACVAVLFASAEASAGDSKSVDCRYEPSEAVEPDVVLEGGFLPTSDVFRPLLADVKEPRFAAAIQRVSFDPGILSTQTTGQGIWAGVVSFGSILGLYGWRSEQSCDGVQISLAGGVFSQFNLDAPSVPLINSDFVIGVPVTFRSGRFSGRVHLYHQSSHLGDEFILFNPQVERIDLGYEIIDVVLSLQDHWWRVYGGGGYIIHSQTDDFARGKAQAGVEFRAYEWQLSLFDDDQIEPVLGLDATSFAERDWGITFSAKGGLSASAAHSTRHIRVMAVFMRGFYPFGQFFDDDQLTNYGLEAQFEY